MTDRPPMTDVQFKSLWLDVSSNLNAPVFTEIWLDRMSDQIDNDQQTRIENWLIEAGIRSDLDLVLHYADLIGDLARLAKLTEYTPARSPN